MEVAFFIAVIAFVFYIQPAVDFYIYKHRGYVQPDDENDTTIITGPPRCVQS